MAAKLDIAPMPVFDPKTDPSNLNTRWKIWIKRFQMYLKAANITDASQKRALLLYSAGAEVQEIFETIPENGEDNDFDTAVTKLTAYFAPSHNIGFEIFQFRQSRQHSGETLEEFHTRFRKLSQTCEFDKPDDEIKRQITSRCLKCPFTLEGVYENKRPMNIGG